MPRADFVNGHALLRRCGYKEASVVPVWSRIAGKEVWAPRSQAVCLLRGLVKAGAGSQDLIQRRRKALEELEREGMQSPQVPELHAHEPSETTEGVPDGRGEPPEPLSVDKVISEWNQQALEYARALSQLHVEGVRSQLEYSRALASLHVQGLEAQLECDKASAMMRLERERFHLNTEELAEGRSRAARVA